MTATPTRGCVSNVAVQVASLTDRCNRFCKRGMVGATLLLAGCWSMAAGEAQALDVNVTNYSWLQLPSTSVTAIQGSTNGTTGVSFGNIVDVRWGDYVWLPSAGMTNNSTQMYYAGVRLDQPRQIENVRLQWWTNGGNTASRYYIDGSNDGTSWTNMANQTVGFGLVDGFVTNVAVTPAAYQYVRVRMEAGDYQSGGGYSGPGFMLIDPIGSGAVSSDKVNWANALLGTSATNTGFAVYNYNNTNYNDGTLENRQGTNVWTGTPGNWGVNEYTTLNLNGTRLLNSASAIWSAPYGGNDFDVEYSLDGITFFSVANQASPINYSPEHVVGATEVRFDPTIATHVRIRNAAGGFSGFTLLNQLLLHGPTEGLLSASAAPNSTIALIGDGSPLTSVTGAVTLENTGTAGSVIGIFGYTITGLDAAEFDLTNFSQMVLEQGELFAFDLEFTSPGGTPLSAILTFNTSVGSISFNLEASAPPAPEPSTALMLGLGCLIPMIRRRRK